MRNGFTLVEMLVSLLIFAMLAAAGVTLLSFSVRAQDVAETRLDARYRKWRAMGNVGLAES